MMIVYCLFDFSELTSNTLNFPVCIRIRNNSTACTRMKIAASKEYLYILNLVHKQMWIDAIYKLYEQLLFQMSLVVNCRF